MSAPEVTVDVRVENHGTLFLFDLLTDEAVAWVVENVGGETSWMGDRGLAVEHRYAREIAFGMTEAGLTVR